MTVLPERDDAAPDAATASPDVGATPPQNELMVHDDSDEAQPSNTSSSSPIDLAAQTAPAPGPVSPPVAPLPPTTPAPQPTPAKSPNIGSRIFMRALTALDAATGMKRAATIEEAERAAHDAMLDEKLKMPGRRRLDPPAPVPPATATATVPPAGAAAAPSGSNQQSVVAAATPPTSLVATASLPAQTPFAAPQTAPAGGQATSPSLAPAAAPHAAPLGGALPAGIDVMDLLKQIQATVGDKLDPNIQRVLTAVTMPNADNFGGLSEAYESVKHDPGKFSTGLHDPGGVSYGSYQLSSTEGTLQKFIASPENIWAPEFKNYKPLTPAFNNVWQSIAARNPDLFRNAQFTFLYNTHYLPTVEKIKRDTGVDLDTFQNGVRAAVFSTTVQHGLASKPLERAITAVNKSPGKGDPGYDEALVRQIYYQRGVYADEVADSKKYPKKPGEKKTLHGLKTGRYPKEQADALAGLQTGP